MKIITLQDHYERSIEEIALEISKSTCQLYAFDEDNIIQPHGSGVLFEHDECYFLFTASHIFDEREISSILVATKDFKRILQGELYRSTLNNKRFNKDTDIDHAILKLNSDLISDIKPYFSFLSLEDILIDHEKKTDDKYLIFGFPENKTKKKKDDNADIAEPLYFVSHEVEDKIYQNKNIDKRGHLLIHFQKKMYRIQSGKRINIPKVEGMSGCGIWLLRNILFDKPQNIEIKLVGIISEYQLKNGSVVVGSRIELLTELLRQYFDLRKLPKSRNIVITLK